MKAQLASSTDLCAAPSVVNRVVRRRDGCTPPRGPKVTMKQHEGAHNNRTTWLGGGKHAEVRAVAAYFQKQDVRRSLVIRSTAWEGKSAEGR